MQTRKNDPAMPTFDHDNENYQLGLSKREFFAAAALQGILAKPETSLTKYSVAIAVNLADLLIIELNKTDERKPFEELSE